SVDRYGNVMGRESTLPFGEDFSESGSQDKHHFTSYERDGETGGDYAIKRDYSSGTRRILKPDLYPASSQAEKPQRWNRYSYALNDPINQLDPTGFNSTQFCTMGYNPGQGWQESSIPAGPRGRIADFTEPNGLVPIGPVVTPQDSRHFPWYIYHFEVKVTWSPSVYDYWGDWTGFQTDQLSGYDVFRNGRRRIYDVYQDPRHFDGPGADSTEWLVLPGEYIYYWTDSPGATELWRNPDDGRIYYLWN